MIRYVEAFFRHRFLLLVPLALAIGISSAYAAVQPLQYQSATSVWFDATPTAADGTALGPDTSSSKSALAVINELLASRAFDQRVGYASALAGYLRDNNVQDQGVGVLVNRTLRATHIKASAGGLSGAALDDAVVQAVRANITAVATGPQLLTISVTAPAAEVAASMATAVVSEFSNELTADRTALANARATVLKAGADQASAQLKAADAELAASLASRSGPAGVLDLTQTRLTQAANAAHQQYADALAKSVQAESVVTHIGDSTGFHVVDKPVAAAAAVSSTKRTVYASLAGLVVGLGIIMALLATIVGADRTARRSEDVETALGIPVAGTIVGFTPRRTPRRAPTATKPALVATAAEAARKSPAARVSAK